MCFITVVNKCHQAIIIIMRYEIYNMRYEIMPMQANKVFSKC